MSVLTVYADGPCNSTMQRSGGVMTEVPDYISRGKLMAAKGLSDTDQDSQVGVQNHGRQQ